MAIRRKSMVESASFRVAVIEPNFVKVLQTALLVYMGIILVLLAMRVKLPRAVGVRA